MPGEEYKMIKSHQNKYLLVVNLTMHTTSTSMAGDSSPCSSVVSGLSTTNIPGLEHLFSSVLVQEPAALLYILKWSRGKSS